MKMKYYIYVELDELDGGEKCVPVSKKTFIKYQKKYCKDIFAPKNFLLTKRVIGLWPDEMSTRLFNLCKKY